MFGRKRKKAKKKEKPTQIYSTNGIGDEWIMSSVKRSKFESNFMTINATNNSTAIMNHMLKTNLSKDILRKIWDLADLTGDGKVY